MANPATALNRRNFGKARVIPPFYTGDTSFALYSGNGAQLPDAPFRFTIYNASDYVDPSDAFWHGQAEICECTVKTGDSLTVERALEDTTAISSLDAKTYLIIVPVTSFFLDSLTPTFNVKGYGAKGDGSTDDTSAVQAAITAAVNYGYGNVYFPEGTYKIGAISIAGNAQLTGPATIQFDGFEAGFQITGNVSRFRMSELILIGSGTGSDDQRGLWNGGSLSLSNFIIYRCQFEQLVQSIDLGSVNGALVSKCRILNTTTGASFYNYGIVVGNYAKNIIISQCYFYRTYRHAVYSSNATEVSISNCIFEEHQYGISTPYYYSAVAVSRGSNQIVSGCVFKYCESSCLSVDDDATVSGILDCVKVIGNTFFKPIGRAISLGPGESASDKNIKNVSVDGNIFVANSTWTSYTIVVYSGFYLNITNNIFNEDNNYASTKYCIVFDSRAGLKDAGFDHIDIHGNSGKISTASGSSIFLNFMTELCQGSAKIDIYDNFVECTDLVKYDAALSNVNINLQLEYGIFNVKSYGAKGDGSTNDTTAIQAALTAAIAAGGGIVYFPEGTYITSATLTIDDASNIVLRGVGASSIIKANAATFNVITMIGTGSHNEIRDLAIYGAATSDGTTQWGIYAADAGGNPSNCIVSKVLFDGPTATTGLNNGINLYDGADHWLVEKCRFNKLVGITASHGYGVHLTTNHAQIIYNTFVGISGTHLRHAVYLSKSACDCLVDGNYVEECNYAGITSQSFSGQPGCYRNKISNNYLKRCSLAGASESGAIGLYGKIYNCVAENNHIWESGMHGMVLSDHAENVGPSDNLLRANFIEKSQQHGMQILGTVECTIDGNYVRASGQATPSTYRDIQILSYPSGYQATKNRVVNNVCWSPTCASAIHVNLTSPIITNTYLANNYGVVGSNNKIVRIDSGVYANLHETEYNVKDFGALGDGSTDDTTAIQNAINAASDMGGGVVFLPKGTYKITSAIQITNDITLYGEGPRCSILKGALSTGLIVNKTPSTRIYHPKIKSLGIDNTDRSTSGGIGLDFSNVSNAVVLDLQIKNVETGIKVYNTSIYNTFAYLEISTTDDAIILLDDANETRICESRSVNSTNGITIDGSTNVYVSSTSVETFTGTGIIISPSSASTYATLTGLRIENSGGVGTGIDIGALSQDIYIEYPLFYGLSTNITNSSTSNSVVITNTGIDLYHSSSGEALHITKTGSTAALKIENTGSGNDITAENWSVAQNGIGTFPSFVLSGLLIISGSGSPEGVVTAEVGSLYLRTDGGASTTFYVKESGSGNTGWVAK